MRPKRHFEINWPLIYFSKQAVSTQWIFYLEVGSKLTRLKCILFLSQSVKGWFWMPILKLHIVSCIELEQRGKSTCGNIGLPRHIFLLWLPTYLPSRHLAQSLWLSNRPGGTVLNFKVSKAINVIKRFKIMLSLTHFGINRSWFSVKIGWEKSKAVDGVGTI